MKPQLIHCSYHKCLTKYYGRTMSWLCNRIFRFGHGYRHFDSRIEEFYAKLDEYRIASINNRSLDLDRIGDCRITRFIRDPRDLVVSGYFYHRRGSEGWCNIVGADESTWAPVNGCVPSQMSRHQSFSECLQGLAEEDGLIAEIEFRKHHFDSMLQWPVDDPRVRLFRYEEILGNEAKTFAEILSFYGLSWPERKLGVSLARWFSARGRARLKSHMRNPDAGQWKQHFTPKVASYFEEHHGELLERYEYV